MINIAEGKRIGKIVAAIRESHRRQVPILIHNNYSVQDIKNIAHKLKLDIPEPLSAKDLKDAFYKNR